MAITTKLCAHNKQPIPHDSKMSPKLHKARATAARTAAMSGLAACSVPLRPSAAAYRGLRADDCGAADSGIGRISADASCTGRPPADGADRRRSTLNGMSILVGRDEGTEWWKQQTPTGEKASSAFGEGKYRSP